MTEAADNPQQAKNADPQRPETEEAVSFGFEQVSPEEKTRRVGGVFAAVADRSDLMNDLMSLGTHRLFKRMVLQWPGFVKVIMYSTSPAAPAIWRRCLHRRSARKGVWYSPI